jgi:hypothetical protein
MFCLLPPCEISPIRKAECLGWVLCVELYFLQIPLKLSYLPPLNRGQHMYTALVLITEPPSINRNRTGLSSGGFVFFCSLHETKSNVGIISTVKFNIPYFFLHLSLFTVHHHHYHHTIQTSPHTEKAGSSGNVCHFYSGWGLPGSILGDDINYSGLH